MTQKAVNKEVDGLITSSQLVYATDSTVNWVTLSSGFNNPGVRVSADSLELKQKGIKNIECLKQNNSSGQAVFKILYKGNKEGVLLNEKELGLETLILDYVGASERNLSKHTQLLSRDEVVTLVPIFKVQGKYLTTEEKLSSFDRALYLHEKYGVSEWLNDEEDQTTEEIIHYILGVLNAEMDWVTFTLDSPVAHTIAVSGSEFSTEGYKKIIDVSYNNETGEYIYQLENTGGEKVTLTPNELPFKHLVVFNEGGEYIVLTGRKIVTKEG